MASNSHIPMPLLEWGRENKQAAFLEWKDFMQSYFTINRTPEEERWNFLLISSGSRGRDLFKSTNLSETDKKDPQKVWEMFERHMVEKPNKWVQRIELQGYVQGPDETIEAFTLRLRNKSSKCSFPSDEVRDDRMVEQLIKGCRFQEERKKLIAKGDKLDLTQAVTMAKSYEASVKHLAEYSSAEKSKTQTDRLDAIQSRNNASKNNKCTKCQSTHEYKKCPAFGTICRICQKPNHWAKACRSRTNNMYSETPHNAPRDKRPSHTSKRYGEKRGNRFRRPFVHDLRTQEYNDESEDDDNLNIDTLSTQSKRNEIFTRIKMTVPNEIHKTFHVKVKVDTGANANIMTVRSLKQIYPDKIQGDKPIEGFLKENKTILAAYGGTNIKQYGTLTARCDNSKQRNYKLNFYVVESDGPNILGLDACRDLGLVKINCAINAHSKTTQIKSASVMDLKNQYRECFDSIGNFPGTFHITLEENPSPVIHPPRKCPIHIRQELKDELRKMEELGVITKVTEPTDWVNSLAYSRKSNGKLRVCLDPKDLNKAIKRVHHKIPTIEEISHRFSGARYFTKLDAQHGYWAIKLDKESQYLTTFNSPFGRYMFKRLPFGLSVSQDIFQLKMDQILEQCDGAIGISDDVCVFGKTEDEHDRNHTKIMVVAKRNGLVFKTLYPFKIVLME